MKQNAQHTRKDVRENMLTSRVAGLECQGVDEEVEEDCVAGCTCRRGFCRRIKAMSGNERRVHVVQDVRPYLTNVVNLRLRLERRVPEWVYRRGRRVRVRADTARIVDHILAHHIVGNSRGCLLSPVCHGVGPALAHAASLGRLQAATRTTTCQAVGDAVRVLVNDNVVFKGTIALGLYATDGSVYTISQ
jgi:hypothetical protein